MNRTTPTKTTKEAAENPRESAFDADRSSPELVILTGLSGSGKASVLKIFEDNGFHAVDNLPIDLIPTFARQCRQSPEILRAALVVDIREGQALRRFPEMYQDLRREIRTLLVYLESDDQTLQRRFSETRRPHPLGTEDNVAANIKAERKALEPIAKLADLTIDTSRLSLPDLRHLVMTRIGVSVRQPELLVTVRSFGFKHGVPSDSDLVFDVRFLPNPNYVPGYKSLTGRHSKVRRYLRAFPQTKEFIHRIADLLVYLLPHYSQEGKSYLTISFGCTGGRHRSVFIAEEIGGNLAAAGCRTQVAHRDVRKRA